MRVGWIVSNLPFHFKKHAPHIMKNSWPIFLLLILFIFSCSDSKNPVASDDPGNENNMVEIQGVVKGPGSSSGKILPVEINNQLPQNTELNSRPPKPAPELPIDEVNANSQETSEELNEENSNTNESPLQNVTVSVYGLSDYISNQENAQLLNSTTTNSEGQYSVSDLEEGIDLVFVAESVPRQTLIVMNVDQESTGDINSATAIVSEYWAGEIADDKAFEEEKFEEMLQTADELLSELSAGELQAVLDGLVPDRFGDGFPDDLPVTLQTLVNLLINIDLAICEELFLEVATGTPTDRRILSGVSDQFGEEPEVRLYGRAESDGVEDHNEIYHPIVAEWVNNSNEMEFIVPLHPSYPMEGGQAEIIIMSEGQSIACPGMPFEIIALNPVPGTTKSMVDNMENALENWANILGYSPSGLRGDGIDELPDYVKPVALGLLAIDGDNFPNNIRAILNNEAPLFDKYSMDEDERALADALFAQSGFANVMNTIAEAIAEFEPTQTMSKQGAGSAETDIWTPAKLDWEMGFQQKFETLNQGAARASRDAAGVVIGTIGIAGAITGAAPVAAVAGVASLNLTMAQLIIDLGEKGLPSELQGLKLTAEPVVYNEEDDATEGFWEASIEARSEGFILNWPTVLGAVPGIGSFSRVLNKFPAAEELTDFTLTFLQNFLTNAWAKHDGPGPIEIKPKSYLVEIDPTRGNEKGFFTWELRTQQSKEAFIFTDNETGYIPKAAGHSELRVRTNSGVFKNQGRVNNIILQIKPIEIDIIRDWGGIDFGSVESPFYIQPGEEDFTLFARVGHAIDKKVKWSVSPEGEGLQLLVSESENTAEVLTNKPGTYFVEAESIAKTGPRADNTPRRYDQARIVVGGLNVTSPGCVETGETYQLSARIGGEQIDFSELEWSITGSGSIDSNGLYTAGGTGEVQIHFQVINQPQLTDTISFSVEELCRSFSASSSEFNFTGECVFFSEYETRGVTTISFGYATFPRAWVSTLEVLSNVMSPDVAWSVTNPGWDWESVVLNSPIEYYGFSSFESDGARNYELEQEIVKRDGADVRVLSGRFEATFEWYDNNNDIQQTSGVLQFSGALPASETDNAWTNCGNL